ncbi:CCC motif membrane protein [Psychroserpens burtonensis]|uniref:CCC motif membrane protein n=1 Tax=Psychroserpens burtonensis TaxID=49278 RepID=UPI0004154D43|nr:CCC motif membrane protein [Psychroserpens burtonensis]
MHNKLPADPTAMILGIIALVISFAGCCCGIFAFIPIIISIIGLVMSNKSLRIYQINPSIYEPQSKSNVSTAKVLNIIALVVSSLVTLFYIAYFIIYGALISTAILEGIEMQNNPDDFNYEWENDSIYKDTDASEREEDSMRVDSINMEELIKIEIDSLNN